MKKIFLLLLVFASHLAFSQSIKVVSNEQVEIPGLKGYFPILSPTGDFLILSGGDMKGLMKYDLATQKLTTITDGNSAGFGAKISADGKTIVYRTSAYKDRLRYVTLHALNIETGTKSTLIKDTRNLQGVSVSQGTVLAVNDGKMLQKRLSGSKLSKVPPVASIKDGKLYVTVNNRTKLVDPAGKDASYLWASVSPSGEKLLYYAMNLGKTYVSNIDGSNPVSLGVLRAPTWMGNDWVVGILDRDNGEVITSSKIIAVKADGTGRTALTDDSIIALGPSVSLDATKIVYNTDDGRIFIMEVETR